MDEKPNIPNGHDMNGNVGSTNYGYDNNDGKTFTEKPVDAEMEYEEEETPRNWVQIKTERPALNLEDIEDQFDAHSRTYLTPKETFQKVKSSVDCSPRAICKSLLSFLPFIGIMRQYNVKTDLVPDIIAGLTIGIMQIPQGMAYALLASVDAVYGLYVSFFPVLIYFFFGTSKHVSLGTFAVVSLMVGSAVDKFDCSVPRNGTDTTTDMPDFTTADSVMSTVWPTGWTVEDTPGAPDDGADAEMKCKLGIATALTFLSGLIQIGMGLLHLGFVTMYLAEPLTRGFTTGCSIHVFTSQVKSIFGVSIGRYSGPWKLIFTYRDLFVNITTTNVASLVTAVLCIIVIYLSKEYLNPPFKKRLKAPLPVDLIIVIAGTLASHFGKFNERWGMEVIGYIPTGIPPPSFPPVDRFGAVAVDAVVVAIVAFAISVSMVQLYAKKYNYETDANQELIAHGVCNSVSANFNCFTTCVSLSRSAVLDSIGVKSQVMALVSCVLILIVLYSIAPLFEPLPNCVLAAIIIVALKGLFMQFKDLPKYWRYSKTDFAVWLITFAAVVLLDVALGLVVGVGFGLLTVVGRTQRPYGGIIGRIPDTDLYRDLDTCDKAEEIKGIKIFRFEGSIYFAARDYFVNLVYEKTGLDPKKLRIAQTKADKKIAKFEKQKEKSGGEVAVQDIERPKAHLTHVIVDCSTMGWLDSMGVSALRQIYSEYREVDVQVYLAVCKGGVREMLEKVGYFDKAEKAEVFPTVHDAVVQALEGTELQDEVAHNYMRLGPEEEQMLERQHSIRKSIRSRAMSQGQESTAYKYDNAAMSDHIADPYSVGHIDQVGGTVVLDDEVTSF